MAYTLPDDVDARPVTIIGAGTLGRRIAAMYAAGGSEVRIIDPAEDQRASARDFVSAKAEDIRRRLRLETDRVGAVETVSDLVDAVPGAWMVSGCAASPGQPSPVTSRMRMPAAPIAPGRLS